MDAPVAIKQRIGESGPFTSAELTRIMRTVHRARTYAPAQLDVGSEPISALPMDLLPHALFGFEPSGRAVVANIHARRILDDGDVLRLDGGEIIEVMTGRALSLRDGPFWLERRGGPALEGVARRGAQGGVVELRDPADASEIEPRVLSSLYRLTPSEAQVARLLHKGLEPNLVADALGVRISTVRTHIAAILRKLGARDLVDLARRLELGFARALGALPSERSRRLL